jgi:ribosomal protein S18 acetylase RimI-like enzyme
MAAPPSVSDLLPLLESDRVWCAYALADLDPHYAPDCTWYVQEDAAVLIYAGLTPPVLFAHGDPHHTASLMNQVPAGRYQFTLMGIHRDLLGGRLEPEVEKAMWRMALQASAFPSMETQAAVRLSSADLQAVLGLTAEHPDRPDAFTADQLAQGVFFGLYIDDDLVAIAGTHVLTPEFGVAAVGNVFTRPDMRGRGLGTQVTAAVVRELMTNGLQTIVLNVAMDNHPAIRVYRKLGFWPYRGYYEGVALLKDIR